jgi:hypothetical protein
MANNTQKTPFASAMERFAQQRALDAYNLTGKGLPCTVASVSGSIVTVNFEVSAAPFTLPQLAVPMVGPEYIRYPTQVGDKGVVIPFDVLLGAISGMGGNIANLNLPPSNLGALVFTAISNVNWSTTDDENAVVIYGPNGFILRDTGKNCTITGDTENITINAKTTLTLEVGGNSIVINSSGITITGTLTINGVAYLAHMHTAVQSGSDISGPVS